jgi:hypothetical protein
MLFLTLRLYYMHLANYNMFKFGFKILMLLNLKWKILPSIKVYVLFGGYYAVEYFQTKVSKIKVFVNLGVDHCV